MRFYHSCGTHRRVLLEPSDFLHRNFLHRNLVGRGGHELLMPDGTGFWTSTVPQHRYLVG